MKTLRVVLILLLLILALPSFALNLDESIKYAQSNNPDLTAAKKKVDAAQAQVLQATAAFLPTIKAQAITGQIYSQPSVLQVTTNAGTQQFATGFDEQIPTSSLDLSITQPIFMGGKILSGYGMAKKNYSIVYNSYIKSLLDVNFNATTAYFGVIRAQKMVELAEQSKTMAEGHLDQIKTMYEVGSATKSDLLRSQVQLANTAVTMTKAKNALAIAKNSFNNILGLSFDKEVEVASSDLLSESKKLTSFEEILSLAYKNRPDWRQFLLSKDMALDNINIARSDYLPSIALVGDYKTAFTKYPGYSTDLRSWSALLSGTWILDAKVPARVAEAQANFESAKASEAALKNAIALDAKNTYLELSSAQETLDSTKKAVDLAAENYSVAEVRYTAGAATNLEVIDAQVALTQARINYLQSQFDIKINQAKLNKTIGKEFF